MPTGQDFEKAIAEALGAARTARSGGANIKGDIVWGPFLIEAKATTKDSITVKRKWLEKIEAEALRQGRYPVLVIGFKPMRQAFAVIPLPLFEVLAREAMENAAKSNSDSSSTGSP
ncbi:MAG: hypothetical protein JRD89_00205 [Deltaproteobacteria bacterium]|nr:hypothetical protein [Deltaproteobacteria bacterium]